jgi:hypothetical protein
MMIEGRQCDHSGWGRQKKWRFGDLVLDYWRRGCIFCYVFAFSLKKIQ